MNIPIGSQFKTFSPEWSTDVLIGFRYVPIASRIAKFQGDNPVGRSFTIVEQAY